MHRALIIAIVMLGVLTPWTRGEIIRLKNGMELQCEILECSEDAGLKIRRLDNGGILDLRWDHILDADVKAIKYARGYRSEEAQPILIRAKRLWLRTGDYFVGIKAKSDKPGMMCLRRQGKLYYFKPTEIREETFVEVEAKDVYTLEELYQQKLEEGLPESARDFFNLAVYCESVTYYEKALELYMKIQEAEPEFKSDVVVQKIKVMEARVKESGATAHLDDVKRMIYRRKFTRALELLDEFEELFPDSVQVGDKEKLRSEALAKRYDFYSQKILTDYFTYMGNAADKIATNKEITLDEALEFAVEEMGPTIRAKLAEVYGLMPEEIEELWASRKGGAKRRASYGTGTFILGPEKAREMPKAPGEEDEEKAEEEEEPLTMDEAIRKKIEEIKKQTAKNKSKKKSRIRMDEIGRTPEKWWETESISNRKRFITAYYAEFSGDMTILKVQLNPCVHCHGKGWLEKINTTGEEQEQKFPCEVCKTIAIERTIHFK